MAPKERKPLTSILNSLPLPKPSSNVTTLVQIEQPVSTEKSLYAYTITLPLDEIPLPTSGTVIEAQHSGISYDMTTEQCHQVDTGTLWLTSYDNNGSLNDPGPEPGYDMTVHQDHELDMFDDLTLEENEQGFWVYDYTDTEHNCPYRDLLARNGDFRLPLALAGAGEEEDSWSTTATICAEDQEDLQDALKESSWT
ncbi:hypothetical protein IFR05_010441 [Cadophora sp. M221]|nr:hypothetical protein IFR05_010441 [Cadophora sp. M221]